MAVFLRRLVPLFASFLASCGISVPDTREIYDDHSGNVHDIELKIKNKIYCELQEAVSRINDPDRRLPFKEYYQGKETSIKPLPDSWGVQMTVQLIIEENSALSPGLTLNTPLTPGRSFGSAVAQSFNLGIGGTVSSDATRTDRFTFYYLVTDLEGKQPACDELTPEDKRGSSLLLESQLGVYKWLNNAMNLRSSVGNSRAAQQEVMSYDVKFDVLSSGNVTPTWKLVRVTTGNGNSSFFSTKRERTHELTITFGPAQSPAPNASGKGGKKEKAQPGILAANDALAQQIGSAVGKAVEVALTQHE